MQDERRYVSWVIFEAFSAALDMDETVLEKIIIVVITSY
jgi:hypothetical protein